MCVLEKRDSKADYLMISSYGCLSELPSLVKSSSYPEDEANGGHSRRGHDFGTVGHQVEQRGHDALRSMVELVAQNR